MQLPKRPPLFGWMTLCLVWIGVASTHAADDSSRLAGEWQCTAPINGKPTQFKMVDDLKQTQIFVVAPAGNMPVRQADYSAVNGVYKESNPKISAAFSGSYKFTDDDTVVMSNSGGVFTWHRVKPVAAAKQPDAKPTEASPAPSTPTPTTGTPSAGSSTPTRTARPNVDAETPLGKTFAQGMREFAAQQDAKRATAREGGSPAEATAAPAPSDAPVKREVASAGPSPAIAPSPTEAMASPPAEKSHGGIGVALFANPDGGAIVTDAKPYYPAAKADVKGGDIIVAADGFFFPKGWKLDQIIPMLGGPVGQPVALLLRRGDRVVTVSVERVDLKAAYHAAAAAGDKQANLDLAFDYANGKGVEKDLSRAAEMMHKSADAGFPQGMAGWGYFLAKGIGVPANPAAGFDWVKKEPTSTTQPA